VATAGSLNTAKGRAGSPRAPRSTLCSATTSSPLLLLLLGAVLLILLDGAEGAAPLLHQALLLPAAWLTVAKLARREGRPTDLMPWSRASLLLTNTRAAQAHEVGGFHTRPAMATHCRGGETRGRHMQGRV
jgi:hypothetical protein